MTAILILTYYHRLASITESMRINIKDHTDKSLEYDKKLIENTIIMKSEEKAKNIIIKELELINTSPETLTPVQRKFSDDNITKLNSSFDKVLDSEAFIKHISSFCTKYLDFDSHSQEFHSYFVKTN